MDKYFTLITVILSGLFGLAVAIATSLLNNRFQSVSYKREVQNKKVESVKNLYVEALSKFDFLLHADGKVMDEDILSFLNVKAKIKLFAAKEVKNLYFKAAEQLDIYNELMRQAYKEIQPGVSIISQRSSKLSKEAQECLQNFHKHVAILEEAMIKHISFLE